MKKSKKVIRFFVIILLFAGCVIGGIIYFLPTPPTAVMEKARLALVDAKNKKADRYNKKLYGQALALYDSAMVAWKRENERFFLFRNFEKVMSFAANARIKADLASSRSEKDERSTKIRLEQGIVALQEKVKDFNRWFFNIPMAASITKKQANGKLLLNEAIVAVSNDDYKAADGKFILAKQYIDEAYKSAESILKNYFTLLPKWQKQLAQTLAASKREGSYVIVVEKFPPRCCLYYEGVLKAEYTAELGKNWLGDKLCEGDNATPEGMYRVTKKLSAGKSKYYKALLLDYPNAEDREQFRKLKKNKEISAYARIGNLIEIHGDGGRGAHWTNGCVALTNGDMDKLFKFVGVGTAVTIIGASQPLEKTIDEYKNYGTKHE